MLGVRIGDWEFAKDVSEWIEVLAIVIIVVGVVVGLATGARTALGSSGDDGLRVSKKLMARGLLLGLDLLIAADIIRTVTLDPTLTNVTALGLLVVIRTFLAWTLVLETENRWPWQREVRS